MAEQDLKPRSLHILNRYEQKKQAKQELLKRRDSKDSKGLLNLLTGSVVNYLSVHEKESIVKIYKDSQTKNFSELFDKEKELGDIQAPIKKSRPLFQTRRIKERPHVTYNPKANKKNYKDLSFAPSASLHPRPKLQL